MNHNPRDVTGGCEETRNVVGGRRQEWFTDPPSFDDETTEPDPQETVHIERPHAPVSEWLVLKLWQLGGWMLRHKFRNGAYVVLGWAEKVWKWGHREVPKVQVHRNRHNDTGPETVQGKLGSGFREGR